MTERLKQLQEIENIHDGFHLPEHVHWLIDNLHAEIQAHEKTKAEVQDLKRSLADERSGDGDLMKKIRLLELQKSELQAQLALEQECAR